METNVLYYGDNLEILRRYIPAESVDLVYLDPPFNSNRTYSAIFADESGRKSDAQIHAFEDSWHWGPTPEAHLAYLKNSTLHHGAVPVGVSQLLAALEFGIGKTPMLAYLVEMAVRLIELHRVLKPTGSLYLHCDPTASHYLKIVLDAVFGPEHFRNEIVWRRSNPKSHATVNFPTVTDSILRYAKGDDPTYRQIYSVHDPSYVALKYRYQDDHGTYRLLPLLNPNQDRPNLRYEFLGVTRVWRWTRERMQAALEAGLIRQGKPGQVPEYKKYLEDSAGKTVTNLWADIEQADGAERLGYPTQKPIELLERILLASTNSGDIVLDPFCGCGTALVAAQKLGRRWIGIDITYLAVGVMRRRLADSFPELPPIHVEGEPTEVEGARLLAIQVPEGRYQFQWWALDEIGALPASGDHKKGADTGIDGRITFTGADGGLLQALVSVKSGHPKADDVRVLKAVCEREGAAIGILVTLDEPTKPMQHEATIAGTYHSDVSGKDYPRIQILSVADLLERGRRPQLPPLVSAPLQRAAKVTAPVDQGTLFGETGRPPGG
ncbi:MAG: DNA methyltransferase, partial [Isosphaeraceae bacterium]|nr:DNA methyltransferase [Isosphaeraceae bacterium]